MVDANDASGIGNRRVALFIDVDNVLILAQNSGLPFHLSLIIERARQQGALMSAKAYGDWTSDLLRPVLGDFRSSAIELVELLTSAASREHKNTADIQLAVDALEMVFSPVRPDTVVIVGGDRDYVPLVQKLRRYGVVVVGIGVEAGVSRVLVEACDSYVYYDDIVPPAPEESSEVVALPDPAEAHSLMRRAVEALDRGGRPTTGAAVHSMMKQLSPSFDLERYKTTFKQLAQDAQEQGYVSVSENPGSDMVMAAIPSHGAPAVPHVGLLSPEYDYSSQATITASYRRILQENRIPLIPWRTRDALIRLIWDEFEERADIGMSLDFARDLLREHSRSSDLGLSPSMIQKLIYSLNFARCFSDRQDAVHGYSIAVPDDVHVPLYPVVGVDEGIMRVHRQYLQVIARNAPVLHPESAYDLLYGDAVTDSEEKDARQEQLRELCYEVKPSTAIGDALVQSLR